MKTGWLITRNSKYVKVMPITAKQYLRDQLFLEHNNGYFRRHSKTMNNKHSSDNRISKDDKQTQQAPPMDNTTSSQNWTTMT